MNPKIIIFFVHIVVNMYREGHEKIQECLQPSVKHDTNAAKAYPDRKTYNA